MTGDLPADGALPGTVAIDRQGLRPVLARLGIRGRIMQVRLLRYRPGRRCTFRVATSGRTAVVKAFPHGAAPVAGLHRSLEHEGLASGRGPTAPALLGWDPQLELIALAWLPGPSLWDLVDSGAGARAGELAAAWLRATAGLAAHDGERYHAAAVAAQTTAVAARLAVRAPDLGAIARDRAAALAAAPPAVGRTGLVHGRFSPEHVLDLGDGPGVLDWDRFGSGPVELDAGQFLAWLARAPGRRHPPQEIGLAARSFTAALADLVDPSALDWYRAAALIALAGRMVERKRRRWPERARTLLAEGTPALTGPAAP